MNHISGKAMILGVAARVGTAFASSDAGCAPALAVLPDLSCGLIEFLLAVA
ncbi:MAG TPA: hypothetical protein VFY27_07365 [Woeseiaceae bacterium]|nr:hypothetical protein [Woeseiaceae bacterium]